MLFRSPTLGTRSVLYLGCATLVNEGRGVNGDIISTL